MNRRSLAAAFAFATLLPAHSPSPVGASTLPPADLAGSEAVASGGLAAMEDMMATTLAMDVGLWPGLSLGATMQTWTPFLSRFQSSDAYAQARLTARLPVHFAGGEYAFTLALGHRVDARKVGYPLAGEVIPGLAGAQPLASWEGMPVTVRYFIGFPVPLSSPGEAPTYNSGTYPLFGAGLTLNAELAIAIRPGMEVVVGGGNIVGFRMAR